MSTRCVITVYDTESPKEFFAIYQHSDGYPEEIIPALNRALDMAWGLPRFEAMDYAAAVVATLKTGAGGTYLTSRASAHGDLAYQYEVRQCASESASLAVTVKQPRYSRTYTVRGWDTEDTILLPLGPLSVQAVGTNTTTA